MEFQAAIYHVLNRGDQREPVFRDAADHQRFSQKKPGRGLRQNRLVGPTPSKPSGYAAYREGT